MNAIFVNTKRVAVLMATYNSEKYIIEQIDSIIAQTYTDWSLYIRDDGSKDRTLSLIKDYQTRYDNIFLLDSHESLGPRDSFLDLLSKVESEYYMFSDHDDIWLSNKIERFVDEIDTYISGNDLCPIIVCSDLKVVDSELNELYPSFWDFSNFKLEEFNDLQYHWFSNNVNGCSLLLNNEVKNLVFPYPATIYMHDSWIVLVTLKRKGIVLPIQEQLMLYRQHRNNTLGAKRSSLGHYFTDFLGTMKRTYNQYLTVSYIERISLFEFLWLKVRRRAKELLFN